MAVEVQLVDVLPLLSVEKMQWAVWSWTVVVEEHSSVLVEDELALEETSLSFGDGPQSSILSGSQSFVSPLIPTSSSSSSLVHWSMVQPS